MNHHIEEARAALERAWRLPEVDPEAPVWDCIRGWDPPPGPPPPMPQGMRLAGILAGLLFPSTRRRPRP